MRPIALTPGLADGVVRTMKFSRSWRLGVRRCTAVLAVMAGAGAAPAAHAQIYAGVAPDSGAVVLSNFSSADTPQTIVAAPPALPALAEPIARSSGSRAGSGANAARRAPPPDLQPLIDQVAARVQLPAELIHAVIAVESNYDRNARSPRGAMGLMQLMPQTARRFGVKNPYDAAENILGGATYLKWLLGVFDNDVGLALAAYNAGEQAVLKAGRRIPPFPETQAYVPRVLALQRGSGRP